MIRTDRNNNSNIYTARYLAGTLEQWILVCRRSQYEIDNERVALKTKQVSEGWTEANLQPFFLHQAISSSLSLPLLCPSSL